MKNLLIFLIFTMPVFAADDKDKWETIKQDQMMCLFQSQIIYDVQSIRNQVPDDGYTELHLLTDMALKRVRQWFSKIQREELENVSESAVR